MRRLPTSTRRRPESAPPTYLTRPAIVLRSFPCELTNSTRRSERCSRTRPPPTAKSALAIGTDGLGVIAYYDATNADLKVAHCSNIDCTTASTTTIDSVGSVGAYTSLMIGSDGLAL